MTKLEMNKVVDQVVARIESVMKQKATPIRKKAKAKASKKTQFKKRVPFNHLYLIVDEKLAAKLSKADQSRYYALCGSIEQLMKSYNSLYDSMKHQSDHNKTIIKRALRLLETEIDSKIEYSNSFERKVK